MPTQAFNFMFKDAIKRTMPAYNPKTQFWGNLAANVTAGAAAGGGSLFLVYPLDFARTRLAADLGRDGIDRRYRGLVDCIGKTYSAGGLRGIYAGFVPSLVMFTIYRGLYFGLYDSAKETLQLKHPALKWAVAVCTSASAGLVIYPLDTVRRRLMMQSGEKQLYANFADCCRVVLQNEGIGGFYKGVVPNVVRGVGGSVILVLYDEIKDRLILGAKYTDPIKPGGVLRCSFSHRIA